MFKYRIEKSVSEIRLRYLKSFLVRLFCVFHIVKYKTQKLISEIPFKHFIRYALGNVFKIQKSIISI